MKRAIILLILLLLASSSHSITLSESIRTALQNNPSVLSAYQKVEAARGQLQQASGALFPSLIAEASTGKSYSDPQTVEISVPSTTGAISQTYSFGIADPQDMRSYSLTLTQPLFTGGAALSGLGSARKNFEIISEDLKTAILNTTHDTTAAYFAILQAQKFIELSEQSLDMSRTHLERAKALFAAGMSTKADILRGEVAEANAEVALLKAKNVLIIAKNSFNNLMGHDLDRKVLLSAVEFPKEPGSLPSYEILLQKAYKDRPDWKQFLLSEQMAEDAVNIAKAQMLPSVLAVGTYGNSIYDNPIYSSDTKSWTAILTGSWTLFDIKVPGQIKEAQANLEAQIATRNSIKNGIALEVRNAYFELKSAMETIASTKKAQDLAEENQKVAETRYNAGLGTNLEALDAQVALTQARIGHLTAQFDLQTAKAKINKSIGKAVY